MLGGGYFEVSPAGTICPLAEIRWEEGSAFRFHYDSEEAPVPDIEPAAPVIAEPSPSYETPAEAAAPASAGDVPAVQPPSETGAGNVEEASKP